MAGKRRDILVTGAASGLGRAITECLIESGDRVIAADISMEGLEYFAGKNVIPLHMDVARQESVQAAAEKLGETVDGLDGLVNCAGIFTGGPLVEIPEEDMKRILDINVMGMYRVTKTFFPLLFNRKGRIVNISSEAARIAGPFNGPYSMSKYAVEAYSDSLRRELMFLGMDVVIIQAGAIRTSLLKKSESFYERYLESSHFTKQVKTVKSISMKEPEKAVEARIVAEIIRTALCSARPKARYRINCDKARIFLTYLPTSWADFLIKKML